MANPSTTAAKAETTAADKGAPAPPPPAYESLKNKNDDDVSNTNASSDSPLNHPNAPPASTEENERTSSSRFEKLTARELLAISPNSDQLLSSSSENGEKDEEETLKCEVGDPKKIGQGECIKDYLCFNSAFVFS